jgi:hypothetical protein
MSPIGLAIRAAGPIISFEIRTHRATDETVQADLRALPGRPSKLTRAATSPARASPSGRLAASRRASCRSHIGPVAPATRPQLGPLDQAVGELGA